MADLLATPGDLRTLLEEDAASLPDPKALLLLELATAEVQAAAGQRLVQVTDAELTIMGTADAWLTLPERPVTAVSEVSIDGGDPLDDFKRFGARLWRRSGWATCAYEPSTVTMVVSHGHALEDQRLVPARKVALGLAANLFANPVASSTGLSIDDYREQFFQSGENRSDLLPERTRRMLRRWYGGDRAGLVRIG